jgi:hypothetical protein
MKVMQRPVGLRTVMLIATTAAILATGAIAQTQQNNTAQPATSRNDGLRSSTGSPEQRVAHPRRKRGGPPGDNPTATPAEGQSDLIKVLQPGQRSK